MADSWARVRLGNHVDLLTGFPFQSSRYVEDTSSPRLLRGDNVGQGALRWDGAKRWPTELAAEFERYQVREGDVILAMDRPWIEAGLKYAAVRASDLPALLVQRVARLRGKQGLDTGFLRYLLGSPAFTEHVLAVQTGTAVPHISASQIESFEFEMPPVDEQRAIAHILGTLDDKIELNRRMNETLEAMAQTLFKSWFVGFEPVRERAAGTVARIPVELTSLFPDSFESSAQGPIPKGWRIVPLGDLVRIIRGRTYKSGLKDLPGPVLLGLASIARNGGFRSDNLSTYGGESPEALTVRTGEIFVSLKDVTQAGDLLGAAARVPAHVGLGRLTQDTAKLVFKSESTPKELVYRTLLAEDYRAYCRAHATGTTNLGLSREVFLSYPVVLPGREVQSVFEDICQLLALRAQAVLQESMALQSIRDYLLPRLITGELGARRAPTVSA